jgi:Type III restriction enzyme, res subunit
MKLKTMKNYIGRKGYAIHKSDLSIKDLESLQRKLLVAPTNSMQEKFGNSVYEGDSNKFPIYRESVKKVYVPRYYGIEMFGVCEIKSINEFANIDVPFEGELRENQIPVVNAYFNEIAKTGRGGALLELECAYGKTVIALNIISRLKAKTLVIVHKEFLMNQWIERISQFLPMARIGKIQGKTMDIDDKDIVIGMLQSLSMKTFPENTFASFGLTIVDECHHISSEVFSCALFNIVTNYTLGLSATMERKDGTSYVIKMFLGEICFVGKNVEKHNVLVKGITYLEKDNAQFNEVCVDYKGNVQYSKMISKLCDFKPRSDFIVQVVCDMVIKSPTQQIMILAHNKSLLTYLFDSIESRNICTIGYYVGGMKKDALKESENKSVIIATFSMASEALDIKTLTSLVMATPKTDIEQSVGRILRQKHAQPVIIDIIDSHPPFKNQWSKRKAFYKSKSYTIQEFNSLTYFEDSKSTTKKTESLEKMFMKSAITC